MARLFSIGFELNSTTASMEVTGMQGTVTIANDIVRTGSYSIKVSGASACSLEQKLNASNVDGPYYVRCYFYVTAYPAPPVGSSVVIIFIGDSSGTQKAAITINSAGILRLYSTAGTQVGSDSNQVLVLNRWYCVELYYYNNTGTSKSELEGRIEGTVFATSTTAAAAGTVSYCRVGSIGGDANFISYCDDWAINDNSGASQTSYPGSGSLICLRPNATGDNEQWHKNTYSYNYQCVMETTPDDGTTFNWDNGLNLIDDYNITNASILCDKTINVVQVGVRFSGSEASNNASFVVRMKKLPSGTVSESSAITPANTTWLTNALAAPIVYPLTLYQDPDAVNWTKNSLDTSQIGIRISTNNTNLARISTLWAYVDYDSCKRNMPGNLERALSVGNGMSRSDATP